MAAAALFEPLREMGAQRRLRIVRAEQSAGVRVIARNLSTLDVELWVARDGRLARFRYLVGEREAAQIFRLPIPDVEGVPGMTTLEGKPVVPPAGMPEHGCAAGRERGADVKGVPLPITQAQADRRRHLYVVGKTGMGKSTLLMTPDLAGHRGGARRLPARPARRPLRRRAGAHPCVIAPTT